MMIPTYKGTFKVGDKIIINHTLKDNEYKRDVKQGKVYTVIIASDAIVWIKDESGSRHPYYHWRMLPATELEDYNPVIKKIKYLDQKFKERKHVKV